jgi:phage-related protein (TIGR01555 family)
MGRRIHASRLITVVIREVPDILKPTYSFGGLSLIQMMIPYVNNWLRTRQSVSDLMHSFTVWVLSTNMSSVMSGGGGSELFKRVDIFNDMRDNRGTMVLDKESEAFQNVSTTVAGLEGLVAQSQEQQSSPAGIPLVKLFGITPSGLNASTQGEIDSYQDGLHSKLQKLNPAVQKILNIVQLSLTGEIDPDIGFIWEPLSQPTATEVATIDKANADTDAVRINSGVIDPQEARQRLAVEERSPYHGLDLGKVIEAPTHEDPTDPAPTDDADQAPA